jgi:hypothetical protein
MEDKKEKVRFIIEKNYELRGKKILVVFQASGHRCGYVGVPKGHPLYGVDYNAISDIEVHGGLTYSDIDFYNNSYANSNYWLLGFDCAHCWDKKDIESLKKYNLD